MRASVCAVFFAASTLYDQVLVCTSAAAALMTALPGKKVRIPSSQEKDCSSSLKVEQARFSQVWLYGAALAAAAAASTGFECVMSGVPL